MITQEQARDLINCWHCKKAISNLNQATYYIWANPPEDTRGMYPSKFSIKVKFHKECFEIIAGEEYMFEGY